MYILGLNAYHADSSAALFKDGVMLSATEEERVTRVKHWAGFPAEAIRFCLEDEGISLKDVDHIVIGRDPKAKMAKKIMFALKNPGLGLSSIIIRMKNSKEVKSLEKEFLSNFPSCTEDEIKSKISYVEHHRAHLGSAFFASPFEEAAVLSIDGSGDFSTTMLGIGRGSEIEVLESIDYPHSVGIFYTALTQYLGFPHYGDEYKVMGLAPYGKPLYVEKVKKLINFKEGGLFTLNLEYFDASRNVVTYSDDNQPVISTVYGKKLENLLGKARQTGEPLTQYHKDIAASVQKITEDLIYHILNYLQKKTGLKKVCIAGGVAQNSVANGMITCNTGFDEIYIPSAGHDAGIAMGSALYYNHHVLGEKRNGAVWNAYTGAHFSNEFIKDYLQDKAVKFTKVDDDKMYDIVSDCLIDGGVVGWFQGRAEFGPRALGGRSILADPRRNDAKELLNLKIKKRESFRPFAPSILEEYVGEYFEKVDKVPFMEKVFPIKKDKYGEIPAVTHVNGTGRLQTVNAVTSPKYHALISRFNEKTGVPILLNTSFNENEPIVNSPEHALNCFLRTQMDMLVLENYIVERI